MIPLEQIQVASPCHADWDAMTGTDQTRFCQSCRKNVYNLSEMTRAEAEALIREKEGRLCVRFYTRTDGTMLTQDCPVGLRAVRYRRARKMSYAAALLLSCGTGLLRWSGAAQAVTPVKSSTHVVKPFAKPRHVQTRHTMGKIAMPRPKTVNPAVGADPFAIPSASGTHTTGMIATPRALPGQTAPTVKCPPPVINRAIMGDMVAPPPPVPPPAASK